MADTFKCPICGKTKEWGENSHMILIVAEPPHFTVCTDCEITAERLNQEVMESETGIRMNIAHAETGLRLSRESMRKYADELETLHAKLALVRGEVSDG